MESKEYSAKISFLRMAPRKVRSVGDLIKGLPVNEAEAQLIVTDPPPFAAAFETLAFGRCEC